MRVLDGSGPGHGEGSHVGNLQGFRDMDTRHSAGTLDQDVDSLARFPRVPEQVVEPTLKVAEGFLEESRGEHGVVNRKLHQSRWVASSLSVLDTVTLNPFLELVWRDRKLSVIAPDILQ
jgi:hypothetical protein